MEQTLRILAAFMLLGTFVSAALNPAAVYCDSLGYKYVTESTEKGDFGYCMLDGNRKVDAWKFIQGEIAPEKSYCARKGYNLKVVNDCDVCGKRLLTGSCAVCVLANGTEQEVTEAMGLTFAETTCGDGRCGFPEDYDTCPGDCKSGGTDELCDGVEDGICDQDCIIQKKSVEDADCVNAATASTLTPGPINPKKVSTTTLPETIPLNKKQDKGCIPFLLAPLSLLTALLAKTL
jgi:putative hemolysin